MTITVNGARRDIGPEATVADIVHGLGAPAAGTAVAVNAAVVPRSAWAAHGLTEGDAVEVLVAAQGG